MQIGLATRIPDDLLLALSSTWGVVQSVGHPNVNLLLHFPAAKPNTLAKPKPSKKKCGWEAFLNSCHHRPVQIVTPHQTPRYYLPSPVLYLPQVAFYPLLSRDIYRIQILSKYLLTHVVWLLLTPALLSCARTQLFPSVQWSFTAITKAQLFLPKIPNPMPGASILTSSGITKEKRLRMDLSSSSLSRPSSKLPMELQKRSQRRSFLYSDVPLD